MLNKLALCLYMSAVANDIINRLRKEINAMSGLKPASAVHTVAAGLGFMNDHFPQQSFPAAAVHELLCTNPESLTVSGAFVAGVLATCMPAQGPVVWVCRKQPVFPPALSSYNMQPHQVVFVHPSSEKEMQWVVEEALKCDGLSAVVAEMEQFSFMQSRRLQLAVEKSGATGFVFSSKAASSTAAVCRWKIESLPSAPADGMPGVGHPRWRVALLKIRNGKPGSWMVEWTGERFEEIVSPVWMVKTERRKVG